MKKQSMKRGLLMYLLIGLIVAVLSYFVLLPFNVLILLLSMTGSIILLSLLILIYIPIALLLSGWVIVKVVEWFGWKRKKR